MEFVSAGTSPFRMSARGASPLAIGLAGAQSIASRPLVRTASVLIKW
jgi:hypothetical protein